MIVRGTGRAGWAVLGFVVAVSALPGVAPSFAQAPYTAPRTPDGHPDFQGVWENRWSTPVERPPGAPGLQMNAEQAGRMQAMMDKGFAARPGNANPDSDFDLTGLLRINGGYRSSLIVEPEDGRLPLTPEGKTLQARLSINGSNNPEERLPSERCMAGPGRAPMLAVPGNSYFQVVQTRGHVVVFSEALHDLRILAPDGGADRVPTLNGLGRASWSGDTLVVETSGFRGDDPARFMPPMGMVVVSPASRVSERFTRVSDTEILYRFTVEDAALYTRPWSAETILLRSSDRMYEFACHEANYSMTNILLAGRAADRGK